MDVEASAASAVASIGGENLGDLSAEDMARWDLLGQLIASLEWGEGIGGGMG